MERGAREGLQPVENLKGRLYSTLLESGVIDNLKTQLRTQILRQLRSVDASVLDVSTPPDPPKLHQRILNSLFIDHLTTQGYMYTLSVFTPECGMASQVPFTREELLHLLHLKDPTSVLSRMPSSDGRRSLAWELLQSLDQLRGSSSSLENGTQIVDAQGGDFMESHLRSIEESYLHRMDTEKLLPYHSLEERMDQYRREVDQRARAEVAAAVRHSHKQVERVRQFEVGAVRMEEATRYRRQLEDAREDLERVHAERLEQLRRREESHRERLQRREKAVETAAYEHRQKILAETEGLREREGKLKQLEDLQLKTLQLHEERLLERKAAVKQREEDTQRYRSLLLVQAEEHGQLRRREVEHEYEVLLSSARKDRDLLEVERTRFAEERATFVDELTAARGHRAEIRQLERQLALAQAQVESHAEAVKDLEDRLAKSAEEKKAGRARLAGLAQEGDGFWSQSGPFPGVRPCHHEAVIEKLQALRAADRKAKKRAVQEVAELRDNLQKQALLLREWQEQQMEWRLVERKMQATIARLQAQAQDAADGKEQALQRLEEVTLRLKAVEREVADVTSLYRDAKAALEAEQLLRSGPAALDGLTAPPPQLVPRSRLLDMFPVELARQAHPHPAAATDDPSGPPVRNPHSEWDSRPPSPQHLPVPVIGLQTAAFSGALARLNELQREEQHMQHALDDYRARVKAGRAQATRAVKRAAEMPESFLPRRREAPASEAESSTESTSGRGERQAWRHESIESFTTEKHELERSGETGQSGPASRHRERGAERATQPHREGQESRGSQVGAGALKQSTEGTRSWEQLSREAAMENVSQTLEQRGTGEDVAGEARNGRETDMRQPPNGGERQDGLVEPVGTESGAQVAPDSGVRVGQESEPKTGQESGAKTGQESGAKTGRERGTEMVAGAVVDSGKVETSREAEQAQAHEGAVGGGSGDSGQSEQEGVLAEAPSEGDDEVRSPASVTTHIPWEENLQLNSVGAALTQVKTGGKNREDLKGEEVKSPDTVKVLVRRKENALPGGDDRAVSSEGSAKVKGGLESPAVQIIVDQEKAREMSSGEGGAAAVLGQEGSAGRGTDVRIPSPIGHIGAAPLEADLNLGRQQLDRVGVQHALPEMVLPTRAGEKAGGGERRRRSVAGPVGVAVLEEVAQLAKREAPNAESRTTTPRDKAGPEAAQGADGNERNSGPRDDKAVKRGSPSVALLKQTVNLEPLAFGKSSNGQPGNGDDADVHSETGSISPVDAMKESMQAWPSGVDRIPVAEAASSLPDVKVANNETTRNEGLGSTIFGSAVLKEELPEMNRLTADTKPLEDSTPVAVLPEARDGKSEYPDAAFAAAPQPSPPLDLPTVSEGTAVEPTKPSIWEHALESARKQEEAAAGLGSPVAQEVEEELEIDYEDATYSEGGLSNLSVPADQGEDRQRRSSESEGW